MAAPGSVWKSGVWADPVWAAGVWADAVIPSTGPTKGSGRGYGRRRWSGV